MVKITELPDGRRQFFIDQYEVRAAAYLSEMGPDAPELTPEQFEELVAYLRRSDEEHSDEDDEEEDDGTTPEEHGAEARRLIREELIALGRQDLLERLETLKEED